MQAHMRGLSEELLALVELTDAAAPVDEARRREVVESLDRLEAAAEQVGGRGRVTNYTAVNKYMDGFLEDVELAREFAEREPANLIPANRLVRSCLSCHQSL